MDELHTNTLGPQDGQAVDALIAAGWDPEKVAPALRERARTAQDVMRLLDRLPAEAPGDLLAERTIRTIERAREAERASQRATALGGGGRGMRWSQVGALAAMLIISVSLALPMLARHRAAARQAACQANLATAGFGFGSYAQSHAGALPAVKSRPGDPWFHHNTFDEQGNAQSNSAHFYLLIRRGHTDAADLACPANPQALADANGDARDWPDAGSRSFSFPNMFMATQPRWNGPATIPVAVDRNPVFTSNSQANGAPRIAPSPNHRAMGGQNVLFNDATVRWMTRPVLDDGDNIWHIERMAGQSEPVRYTGNETPDDVNDAFLIP